MHPSLYYPNDNSVLTQSQRAHHFLSTVQWLYEKRYFLVKSLRPEDQTSILRADSEKKSVRETDISTNQSNRSHKIPNTRAYFMKDKDSGASIVVDKSARQIRAQRKKGREEQRDRNRGLDNQNQSQPMDPTGCPAQTDTVLGDDPSSQNKPNPTYLKLQKRWKWKLRSKA